MFCLVTRRINGWLCIWLLEKCLLSKISSDRDILLESKRKNGRRGREKVSVFVCFESQIFVFFVAHGIDANVIYKASIKHSTQIDYPIQNKNESGKEPTYRRWQILWPATTEFDSVHCSWHHPKSARPTQRQRRVGCSPYHHSHIYF